MKWFLENVALPIIIVVIGLLINNWWKDYNKPEIFAKCGEFVVKKELEKYRIESNFAIFNRGRSRANKHSVTIKAEEEIKDIIIAPEYLGKMECYLGGKKHKHVCYSVTLDEDDEVRGKIVFYNNVGWPEQGIKPITIHY